MTTEPLTSESFFYEFTSRKGLIPVELNIVNQTLIWMDMEGYHFYEGFFHKSVRMFAALKSVPAYTCTTTIDILNDSRITKDSVHPTGFIFHAGRCGSTLLAKVLSRSAQNLVLSEAEPLNVIWSLLTCYGQIPLNQTDENLNTYRNLLLALARKRLSSHKRLFIKFTSFNINLYRFIRAAFPDVPAVFLNRDKGEILRSWQHNLPGWLSISNTQLLKLLTGATTPDLNIIVESFLKAGNSYPPDELRVINYQHLTPENLPAILNYFNVVSNEAELRLMKTQFMYDSKQELNRGTFDK